MGQRLSLVKYVQVVTEQRPQCGKLVIDYICGFFALTAIVVYGNFWYDLAHYLAGSESLPSAEQLTILTINASVSVVMGVIAFLLECMSCHRSH